MQVQEIIKMLSYQELPIKMYGLLFLKPRTVTDLSLTIYGKKRQLSQINRVKKKFHDYGIITDYIIPKQELMKMHLDPRLYFWKATSLPLIYYWDETLKARKEQAKKPNSNYTLNQQDKEILELLLSSDWFKSILNSKYDLKEPQTKTSLQNRFFLNVLDNITTVIGEIGAISLAYHVNKTLTNKPSHNYIISKGNFDTFIKGAHGRLNANSKAKIQVTLDKALQHLGVKRRPWIADYYKLILKDSAPVFIPFSLSKKLASLGRIETTLMVAFENR